MFHELFLRENIRILTIVINMYSKGYVLSFLYDTIHGSSVMIFVKLVVGIKFHEPKSSGRHCDLNLYLILSSIADETRTLWDSLHVCCET